MESGVPSLELLHDALEEPVRPLQQAGALHRSLDKSDVESVEQRKRKLMTITLNSLFFRMAKVAKAFSLIAVSEQA